MELRDLGARVRLYAPDGDDLGFCHAPRPLEPGDVLALAEGLPWEVTAVVALNEPAELDALCEVEPVLAGV